MIELNFYAFLCFPWPDTLHLSFVFRSLIVPDGPPYGGSPAKRTHKIIIDSELSRV